MRFDKKDKSKKKKDVSKKSTKFNNSLKPKQLKTSGKIGSSQKKRLEKKIQKKFKPLTTAKGEKKNDKLSEKRDVKEVNEDLFGLNNQIDLTQFKQNDEESDNSVNDMEMTEENNSEVESDNSEVVDLEDVDSDDEDVDNNKVEDLENDDDIDSEDVDLDNDEEEDVDSDFKVESDTEFQMDVDGDKEELSDNEVEDDEVEISDTEGEIVRQEETLDDIVHSIQTGENVIKVTDYNSLDARIKQNYDIISNFKEFREKAGAHCKCKKDYTSQWLEDLCLKYSYNKFLMNKLYYLFNLDVVSFLEACEESRPVTIRANSIKTTRRKLTKALNDIDVNVQNLEFTKVGMVVYSAKVSIGATREYLGGSYILQGASSLTPVLALAPKPGETVLDMCCAPGGKTSHIAQIMRNSGIIVANDINKDRMNATIANLTRLGINNVAETNFDGKHINKHMRYFDRVLLDAPCTGTGVITRDPSVKSSKDESDMKAVTIEQKKLMLAAADSLKVGGFMVYSTCSILTEENEEVVAYVCRKRHMKIVETGLFGTPGFVNFRSRHFEADMARTRRYYPHVNNMDGFFVAKLQKIKDGVKAP